MRRSRYEVGQYGAAYFLPFDCEIVRKADIGVKKYCKTPRVGGEDYPRLLVPVQRLDRVEAWEEWVEEGTDSKEVIRVMRDIFQRHPRQVH